jgi:DHA2 family methylenomycin A resistance protein-like MFS transporter
MPVSELVGRVRTAVTPRREPPWVVLCVTGVGYFLVLLDVTIVNVALPSIGKGLRTSVPDLQWVVDGYSLALAALMLPSGAVGDRYGHKRVVLTGLTVFGLGSLVCGLAPNVAVLIAARAVQGVGAALLLPGSLAIISRAYQDSAARARAIGVWSGVGSLALPAGPIAGGALIDAFGWRAVFLVNVPIVLLSLLAAGIVVRESRDERAPGLDGAGTLLGVLLLVSVTYAFIQGGRSGAGSPATIVAGVVAVLALVAFVLAERRKGEHAMLPIALLHRPTFALANTAAGVMNLGTLGVLFVLTLFLQSVQHRSPLGAGVALLPVFASLAVIAPLSGRLVGRIGARWPIIVGLLVAAVGLGLLGALSSTVSYPALLLPAFLAWGIGLGVLTPAVVAASVSAVAAERSGLASAVNNTARQTGGAIGVAVAGAVAGQPGAAHFLGGLRVDAVAAAALYAAVAVLVLVMPWSEENDEGADGAG